MYVQPIPGSSQLNKFKCITTNITFSAYAKFKFLLSSYFFGEASGHQLLTLVLSFSSLPFQSPTFLLVCILKNNKRHVGRNLSFPVYMLSVDRI